MKWLIIGVSGVSCGGKTTLANRLYKYLNNPENHSILGNLYTIRTVKLINQDNYFLAENNEQHKWITQLNHINWDIITALDMNKMTDDLMNILGVHFLLVPTKLTRIENELITTAAIVGCSSDINILIIEGFLIFTQLTIRQLCQIKFHIHLPYEVCYARRSSRIYDPADVPGYFEMCVWPMYQMYFKEFIDRQDVLMLNGETDRDKCFNYVVNSIKNLFEH